MKTEFNTKGQSNKDQMSEKLARKLKMESKLVRKDSMEVLAEFEAIENIVMVKQHKY